MRADQLLVERGMAASRSQAQRLIAGGLRWRSNPSAPWRSVGKNGDDIAEGAALELEDAAEARYVSRGGLKLEGALKDSGLDVRNKRCLDVGQSTGGFTDCLLQHGASAVVGIDVGHGQLHPRLREDPRMTAVEGINARHLDAILERADGDHEESVRAIFDAKFEVLVGDLSFISLTLVLPALMPLLDEAGDVLMLVKPQFELQPHQVGKGGIVRDPTMYALVEARIRSAAASLGLEVLRWFPSPIEGGDGNQEFFFHARLPASDTAQSL
jgi:23S rRNA (cytidine1920-2'-O)/16S rRNA (cytidine1409-2'-O)-methyltransferase